ncbi:MAG: hypothetical protein EBR51_06625, partial [Gammaproteobacteria bacterium]|nr:hypothetical protein [Gammaproteobacteria bacterium]
LVLERAGERPQRWVLGVDEVAGVQRVARSALRPVPCTTSICEYGGPWSASVARGRVHGVQFHPERSGAAGALLLANFLQCS